MDTENDIGLILIKLGLGSCLPNFQRERITPDIVCELSMHEMRHLGISNSSDMMKLRVECIKYGRKSNVFHFDRQEPKYNISKETLVRLIQSEFKINEMSKLLSVSERTIYRRMNEYNISVYQFTDIDDQTLQTELRALTTEYPRVGETMIRQILHQRGIRVTRSRLRDQVGIAERLRRRLHRRVYNVTAPNHLWHLDSNHKLIIWHFIICGGIDGFSRFIVYLQCVNNNKADIILRCFLESTETYGIPLRIRTDQGMENIKVAEHMIKTRGLNKRSVIAGKSTHNQRIERLWRDVYEGVLCFYYDLFHFMEDSGILDLLNEHHIYALHHVFKNKINEKLEIWRMAWARHRLRTARSSPLRLFTAGAVNFPVDIPITEREEEYYGVEGEIDLNVTEMNNPGPSLESLDIQVSYECEHELDRNCHNSWTSNNYGIDIYLKAVEIMQRHMV